jgi:hypothetical protein
MVTSGTARVFGFGPAPVRSTEKTGFSRRLAGPAAAARGGDDPAPEAKRETDSSRNGTEARAPMLLLPSSPFAAQVIGQMLYSRRTMSRQVLRSYADASGICGANFEIEVV